MNIIHLSDLHIGKSNNQKKASRIVEWIIEHQETHQSEVVIISGDVVDDGQTWQFEAAKNLLDELKEHDFTVLAAPGNHDYGPSGFRESNQSQEEFAKLVSGIREYPHLHLMHGQAFILMDSMAEEIKRKEFWGAQGYLGREQLQKLDQMLDDLEGNPAVENVVLVLHHHPFDFLFFHGMRDHADLKGVISRRENQPPRVNVLLFGHKHIEHRFNDSEENKEELFGIDMIYASGQTVERNKKGKMVIPVINLGDKSIERYLIR